MPKHLARIIGADKHGIGGCKVALCDSRLAAQFGPSDLFVALGENSDCPDCILANIEHDQDLRTREASK